MCTNKEVELGLRKMLEERESEVRLAAFEALDKRGDTNIAAIGVGVVLFAHRSNLAPERAEVVQTGANAR